MGEPAVVVEGLVKRFGEVTALAGVDLTVPAGTVLGLLGPNGAGKTTLIRVVATLLRADAGRARVLGTDVAVQSRLVRRLVGLSGQYAAVDGYLTGRENLRMIGRLSGLGRRAARQRAEELLAGFDLTGAADRTARSYSGGMRRRLDVAASLVAKPAVLFLDEPTTGLDPRGRLGLWALIARLAADGTTALLTTQYLEEADRLADRIAVIDHGRLLTEGTSEQLKGRIGGAMLEVHLPPDLPAADRERAVAALNGAGAGHLATQADLLVLPAPDGVRTLAEALRRLDAAGVAPDDVALRKPTLDEVFLTLTGRTHDLAQRTGTGAEG